MCKGVTAVVDVVMFLKTKPISLNTWSSMQWRTQKDIDVYQRKMISSDTHFYKNMSLLIKDGM